MTQWKSRDSNSEVCLTLDWVAGRGGGLPASGGASHGFMVLEDFCIEQGVGPEKDSLILIHGISSIPVLIWILRYR